MASVSRLVLYEVENTVHFLRKVNSYLLIYILHFLELYYINNLCMDFSKHFHKSPFFIGCFLF